MVARTEQNMSRPLREEMKLDNREARQVERASRRLDLVPVGAPADAIFDVIRSCVPLAAGLFCNIRPGMPDALATHAVGLPPEVLESWLGTSIEQLAGTLAPVVTSRAGLLLRDSETLTGAQRESLEVLHKLDAAGLGEGAGFKIFERPIPWHGAEHFMLALLMERGAFVPPRAQALLAALNPALGAAVLRTRLMLQAREPILAQIVADESYGYVCLSRTGAIVEANRRAHQLVIRYQGSAGITGRRHAVTEFAARARREIAQRGAWHLQATRPAAALEVNAYQLAREPHALSEDLVVITMKELFAPAAAASLLSHSALAPLTRTQRRIALLLVNSGDSIKQIADVLSIKDGTVRKHAENIYRALGVHSRPDLTRLLR
jgi:DNA-binding CsgD family transcriptional regulator